MSWLTDGLEDPRQLGLSSAPICSHFIEDATYKAAEMPVLEAIQEAEAVLPGVAAPDGQNDPRWQRIITVGEYIQTDPDAVWTFVSRWGRHEDPDLRAAISTCLLEHLLEEHFETIFPRVEQLATENRLFGLTSAAAGYMLPRQTNRHA